MTFLLGLFYASQILELESSKIEYCVGTVYKPRRQVRGRVAQMSTLLNKSYLVKVSTKGEGGQKCSKFCLRGLYIAPKRGSGNSFFMASCYMLLGHLL